jgi:ATP-dependent Clp protease ATP-binding subunit ClpC
VRRKSYSVILLDEIEKAHPEAFNMLLQIMEDGNLADAKGRRVDFRNTIIIMTSNVGADVINRDLNIGFSSRADSEKSQKRDYELMKDKVVAELKKTFKPEFINRLDGVIVFHSLNNTEIRRIADLLLNRLRTQMKEQDLALDVSDEAMDLLAKRGYDPNFGARPLRRIIQNLIEDPLAEGMLESRFPAGGTIGISVENDLLKLDSQPAPPAEDAPAEEAPKAKRKSKADKEAAGVSAGGDDEPEPVA